MSRDGPSLVVRTGTDRVDRITPTADGRAAKELWVVSDGHRSPQDPPDTLGVGVRD